MARIRTIKPEFWASEQIVECSTNARLLFVGMWNFCDDDGRHKASFKNLKAQVFPADNIDVEPLVGELIQQDLVIEYERQGVRYWQVTGWKHQRIDRKRDSDYPGPFDDGSTIIRRGLDEDSTLEGKGRDTNTQDPMACAELKSSLCGRNGHEEKKFQKPTIGEIAKYCEGRSNAVDPEAFFAFYESKGWMVGKNRMKDWQAAVRTWEQKRKAEAEPTKPRLPTREESLAWRP